MQFIKYILNSDENVIWEENASDDVCTKEYQIFLSILLMIYFIVSLGISFFFINAVILAAYNFLIITSVMFTILAFLISSFILIACYPLVKEWRDRPQTEKYLLTTNRILLVHMDSRKMRNLKYIDEIFIKEIVQYHISVTFFDRLSKKKTYSVYFYQKYSFFPKVCFLHITKINELKVKLDTLINNERIKQLGKKEKKSIETIEWREQTNHSAIWITCIAKILSLSIVSFLTLFCVNLLFSLSSIFDMILYILVPLILTFSFFLIIKSYRLTRVRFYIKNSAIFREEEMNPILKLDEIIQFQIKFSFLSRILKLSSPTLFFYKDFTGKSSLTIPFVTNYEDLKNKLMDFLLQERIDIIQS